MTAKTVLVTGASRGLGAAIARALPQLGARVVLAARSTRDMEAVAREIAGAGGEALAVTGDVGRPEDCARMVAAAIERFGRLDALVNNAAVLEPIAPLAGAEPQAWQAHLAINVLGPVMLTKEALPHLRAQHGCVVNVSTGAAVNPIVGWGAYCMSKAALNLFTRVLAVEEPQITALAVAPGAVDTPMQATVRETGRAAMAPDVHARFIDLHARGALLPPDVPGRALAVLALYALHEWSGNAMPWNDPAVQALVEQHQAPG